MDKRKMQLYGLAAAVCGAFVPVTVASLQAAKGAEDVSGVWAYEETVDASTCAVEPIGTKRGLVMTVEQGPPAKDGTSKVVVNTDGPSEYFAYAGRYDLAAYELRVEAASGKKNIAATSSIEGKVSSGEGNRMEGTRNVKIVESKKGKTVSSCKILMSFTARRL